MSGRTSNEVEADAHSQKWTAWFSLKDGFPATEKHRGHVWWLRTSTSHYVQGFKSGAKRVKKALAMVVQRHCEFLPPIQIASKLILENHVRETLHNIIFVDLNIRNMCTLGALTVWRSSTVLRAGEQSPHTVTCWRWIFVAGVPSFHSSQFLTFSHEHCLHTSPCAPVLICPPAHTPQFTKWLLPVSFIALAPAI